LGIYTPSPPPLCAADLTTSKHTQSFHFHSPNSLLAHSC